MHQLKNYWVSWHASPTVGFTLDTPWWTTGFRDSDGANTICAAVFATSETDAQRVIFNAHDDTTIELEWRFVTLKGDYWSPFCERFQKADWMEWPE